MKNLFSFRLYVEGLKKIKLIGIAATIVTVALCAIIPVIYMADTMPYNTNSVYDVEINEFAMPLVLIMLFAPFFVKSMFSYLNLRRESDYYHAIPYKRETVYTSFMLAALTWCAGIITAAVLVTSVLWTVAPNTSYELSYIPLLILSTTVACMLLMAFMAVAMSLTGTASSNIFIFGLLACFFRVACFLFTYAVENTVYIWDASSTFLRFTDISFFFPIALLGGMIGGYEPSDVYTNVPMYIYTVAVSIALLVLAGFLYVRRRSEMASKSAPSKRLQHVYRIAFTTPFVLLTFTFIATDLLGGDAGMDITFYIFMCFVIGIVYFLYELITTKSPKSMLRATPYLVILLAVGCLFVGAIGAVKVNVLSKTPDVDEIESVTFKDAGTNRYYSELDYETLQCRNIEIRDEAVLEYVAEALEFSVDSVKEGTYSKSREYLGFAGGKEEYTYYTYATVRIKLTNGQTIGRKLKFSDEDYTAVRAAANSTEEYGQAYLRIPKPEQLYSIYWNSISSSDMMDVYECFYEEYNYDLTHNEKLKLKSEIGEGFGYRIECYGRENFESYVFAFRISHLTPKTLNAFAAALADADAIAWSSTGDAKTVSNEQAVKKLMDDYIDSDGKLGEESEEDKENGIYTDFSFGASLYLADGTYSGWFDINSVKKMQKSVEAVTFIRDALNSGKIVTRYTEGAYILTLNAYYFEELSLKYASEDQMKQYASEVVYVSSATNLNAELILFTDEHTAKALGEYLTAAEEAYGMAKDLILE